MNEHEQVAVGVCCFVAGAIDQNENDDRPRRPVEDKMIKDKDVAHYPEITREQSMDIFGKRIRISTVFEGRLFRIERHVPTEELVYSYSPNAIVNDAERSAEDELDAAVQRAKAARE